MAQSTQIPVTHERTLPLTAKAMSAWQDRLMRQEMAHRRRVYRTGIKHRVTAGIIVLAYIAFPFYGNWLLTRQIAADAAARSASARYAGGLR